MFLNFRCCINIYSQSPGIKAKLIHSLKTKLFLYRSVGWMVGCCIGPQLNFPEKLCCSDLFWPDRAIWFCLTLISLHDMNLLPRPRKNSFHERENSAETGTRECFKKKNSVTYSTFQLSFDSKSTWSAVAGDLIKYKIDI